MVRLVAIASALLGITTFAVYLHVVGKAPWETLESRHLREMKDREAEPAAYEPITGPELYALPVRESVAEYSGLERRAVALDCEVGGMHRATDGDFHLTCRIPDADQSRYLTAEVTPQWRGTRATGAIDAPGWGYEQLAAVFRPSRGTATAWLGGSARVRISGWLLYDGGGDVLEHWLRIPRKPRPTDWEIHPITKIERWDDRLAGWVEVPR